MRLLLIGCTGFIGRELIDRFSRSGHELIIVSRNGAKSIDIDSSSENIRLLQLDPGTKECWENESLLKALAHSEGVINLAGEPIAEKRWTEEHLAIIQQSRLKTTEYLLEAMKLSKATPKVMINGSAIGFYGTSANEVFTEKSKAGNDFLAKLCKDWEGLAATKPEKTRLVIFRIGIVLEQDGGALKKMLPIFKAGLGGPIGTGQQWMSWIHRKDLCSMIEESLKNPNWSGVFNATSPEPVRMSEFAAALGKRLGRPSLLQVPGPILKLLLGDGAKVVLEGQKVISGRLKEVGFKFNYPTLSEALREIKI